MASYVSALFSVCMAQCMQFKCEPGGREGVEKLAQSKELQAYFSTIGTLLTSTDNMSKQEVYVCLALPRPFIRMVCCNHRDPGVKICFLDTPFLVLSCLSWSENQCSTRDWKDRIFCLVTPGWFDSRRGEDDWFLSLVWYHAGLDLKGSVMGEKDVILPTLKRKHAKSFNWCGVTCFEAIFSALEDLVPGLEEENPLGALLSGDYRASKTAHDAAHEVLPGLKQPMVKSIIVVNCLQEVIYSFPVHLQIASVRVAETAPC